MRRAQTLSEIQVFGHYPVIVHRADRPRSQKEDMNDTPLNDARTNQQLSAGASQAAQDAHFLFRAVARLLFLQENREATARRGTSSRNADGPGSSVLDQK